MDDFDLACDRATHRKGRMVFWGIVLVAGLVGWWLL